MFKRLAATPQFIGAGRPVLRVIADSSSSDAGVPDAGVEEDVQDARALLSSGHGQRRSDAEDAAFERAVAHWQARGYKIQYRDAYLVQLVRWRRLDWLLISYVVAGIAGLAFLAAARRGRLARPWHVVTLARTPDQRVITHEQWANRPPAA